MATPYEEHPMPTFPEPSGTSARREKAAAGQSAAAPLLIPSFQFSTSALTVLNQASDPSQAAPTPTNILLAALAYGYQRGGVGQFMLQALADRRVTPVSFSELTQLVPGLAEQVTPQLLETAQQAGERAEWFGDLSLVSLFERAADYAAGTIGRPEIHVRHLVAAVVLAADLDPPVLAGLGVTADELPDLLLSAVRGQAPGDDQQAWEALLAPPLAGGISREFVDPRFRITRADDDLNRGVWAGMFAAVMADKETPLPLSVGLFGAWGSGKSHFMGLLRSEIDALRGQPGYVTEVVHVRFNAWHYADANLWASLGDEIFRALAEAAQPPQDTPPTLHEEAARLQQQIDSERAAAELHRKAAEEARLRTEKYAGEIRKAQEKQPLTARQLAVAALETEGVRREVQQACDLLEIPDGEQAQVLTQELAATARDGIAVRALLRQPLSRAAIGVCLVALVIALAGTLIPLIPAGWGTRLRDSGGLASAAALLGFGSAALSRVSAGLAMLRSAAAKAARDNEKQAEQAVAGVRAQLHQAQDAERTAAEQLTKATALLARHERELGELMPGRQLYTFLAERAASGDYAGQLGLVSVIRKDLERLVKRLEEQDAPGPWPLPGDPARQLPRRIDRIVLYIDDLDRCQPRQVVEVLQAVHLLLALNLFIVVVGVDPNWLIRSLRDQYPDVLDGRRPAAAAEADEGAGLGAHPADYLEKIFNIPFTLPGFGEDGMADMAKRLLSRLADGRTGDGTGTQDGASPGAGGGTAPAGGETAGTGGETAGTGGEPAGTGGEPAGTGGDGQLRAEPGSLVATAGQPGAVRAATRQLTANEIGFLARLGPFTRTPRDAKRLFNVYRMIRATRDLSSTSPQAFLGGEYQAVALLLAMVTLDAQVLCQVLDAPADLSSQVAGGLAARPAQGFDWGEFAIDLAPLKHEPGPGSPPVWRNRIIGEIPGPDVRAWERMFMAVAATSEDVTLHGLRDFKSWAPAVRRFSYALLTEDTYQ